MAKIRILAGSVSFPGELEPLREGAVVELHQPDHIELARNLVDGRVAEWVGEAPAAPETPAEKPPKGK